MKRILSPSAVAVAICVLIAAPSAYAQPAAHSVHTAAAASTVATSAATKRYELHTNIVDGKMVFVDNKGQVNPVLEANTGDTVEVVLESGEGAEHDMDGQLGNILTLEPNAAAVGLQLSRELVDQGGLAGAVGADDGVQFALADVQRHRVGDEQCAIALGECLGAKYAGHHGSRAG